MKEFLKIVSSANKVRSRRSMLRGLMLAAGWVAGSVLPWRAFAAGQGRARKPLRLDVTRFGAVGDGSTLNTLAIQKAIDACSTGGGGVVYLPPGRFVSGTLLLKSGVVLELDAEAQLLGSLNPADYAVVDAFVDGVGAERGYTLLGSIDAQGIGVQGSGTIDGRGAQLQQRGTGAASKPFLVRWVRSSEITVRDVRLVNSSAWTMHFFQCAQVAVERVSIRSLGLANNDGIDIDSSQHVQVRDCTIETGDDSICLKTTSRIACADIQISGCVLASRCAAFKIGTETFGDFGDIRVSRCHVKKAGLAAIKILSVDGAQIRGITVEDLLVDEADTPIFVRLGARLKTFRPDDVPRSPGSITGVQVRNVTVADGRRVGILLSGIPGHLLSGIVLDEIQIIRKAGTEVATDVPVELPEKEAAYPEVRMFGNVLPAYGMYVRHAEKLTATNIRISGASLPAQAAVVCNDAKDVRLAGWTVAGSGVHASALRLEGVRKIRVEAFHAEGDWPALLQVKGGGSEGIEIDRQSIGGGIEQVEFSANASPSSVRVR